MDKTLCLPVLWHLALWLAVAAWAGGTPGAATPAERVAQKLAGSHWYKISILGHHSGYGAHTMRPVILDDGTAGLETTEQTFIRISVGGAGPVDMRMTQVRRYDAQLVLLSTKLRSDQGGRQEETQAIRTGDSLQVTRKTPAGERIDTFELPAGAPNEMCVPLALVDGELAVGWNCSFVSFDAEMMALDTIEVEIVGEGEEPEPYWEMWAQSGTLGMHTLSHLRKDGVVVRQEIPGLMQLAMVRVSEEEAVEGISPLLIESSIPVPANIVEPAQILQMTLAVSTLEGEITELVPATARQQVARRPDGSAQVVVNAQPTPQVILDSLPVTSPELQAYLQPTDLTQSADPRIINKAREIVSERANAWQAARELARWVFRNVRKMESEPRQMSALEIMDTMAGDCTEHAVLYGALAQAAGLPVRMVAGIAWQGGSFHYHAWNEVHVGEWVEIDPTWGQMQVDGGHIRLAHGAFDTVSVSRMSLNAGRSLGMLSIELEDYRLRE